MERIAKVHIEKLPEGYFLATSDDIQGLVAQSSRVGCAHNNMSCIGGTGFQPVNME